MKRLFGNRRSAIVLAATAIVLVASAIAAVRVRRQQAAVETIRDLGGRIGMETAGPSWLAEARTDWGLPLPRTVVFVSFRSAGPAPSADLPRLTRALQELDRVRWLDLAGTPVGDAQLGRLKSLDRIEHLDLSSTRVTDEGLRHLAAFPRLRSLDLSNTEIGDEGLARLATLPRLESLYLDGTRVTDRGLAALAGLPDFSELTASNTAVTEVGLLELMGEVPHLAVSDD